MKVEQNTVITMEEGDKLYVVDLRNKEREIVEIVLQKEHLNDIDGWSKERLALAPGAELRSGRISLEGNSKFDYAFSREVTVVGAGMGMSPRVNYYKNYNVLLFVNKEDAQEHLDKIKKEKLLKELTLTAKKMASDQLNEKHSAELDELQKRHIKEFSELTNNIFDQLMKEHE